MGGIMTADKPIDPQTELDALNARYGATLKPSGDFTLADEIEAIKQGARPVLGRPAPTKPTLSIVKTDDVEPSKDEP